MPVKFSAKPFIELLLATTFWGFGFVATVWCLDFLSPVAIVFYRFLIAFLLGLLVLLVLPFLEKPRAAQKWNINRWQKELHHEFKLSLQPGLILAATLVLQTWGLQTTTATKSAFITTLYVVLVPLFAGLFYKSKLSLQHWLWVFTALIGTLLISEFNLAGWNLGDTLTFLNAVTASFQIIMMGRVAQQSRNHFMFSVLQSFWIFLVALVFFPFTEKWDLSPLSNLAWFGLLSLAVGSSLLAFFLQVRAQKKLDAAIASVLFLLESPISFFFAYFLLNERLSLLQSLGAGLILLACLGVSLFHTPRAHSAKREF